MIGMRPIGTLRAVIVTLPRWYRRSTYTGAEYERSRSRHSCGVTGLSDMSSVTDGRSTYMFV